MECKFVLRASTLVLLMALAALPVFAAEEGNYGEDITRPLTRTDLRAKVQALAGGKRAQILTWRTDKPFVLTDGGQFWGRLDIPFGRSDAPSADNPNGEWQSGLADTLIQGLLVSPPLGTAAYAAGAQVIFPTASEDSLGTGKYQLLPSVAARYKLDSWMKGAWVSAVARHAFDFASRDPDRPGISQTYLQGILNINLPNDWYINFAPETRYDWNLKAWHVPFDISIGRMVKSTLVLSVEYKSAIVSKLPLYKQEMEFRLGYFFL